MILALGILTQLSARYIGIGYGVSTFRDAGYFSDLGTTEEVHNDGTAYRITLGGYISDFLSVEIDYCDFGDYEARSAATGSVNEAFTMLGVVVGAHYPFDTWDMDLFVKFGAGEVAWEERGFSQNDDSAGAILIGAGYTYHVTDTVYWKIGYDRFLFDMINTTAAYDWQIDYWYTGAEIKF